MQVNVYCIRWRMCSCRTTTAIILPHMHSQAAAAAKASRLLPNNHPLLLKEVCSQALPDAGIVSLCPSGGESLESLLPTWCQLPLAKRTALAVRLASCLLVALGKMHNLVCVRSSDAACACPTYSAAHVSTLMEQH
jgi:hypothetical protein